MEPQLPGPQLSALADRIGETREHLTRLRARREELIRAAKTAKVENRRIAFALRVHPSLISRSAEDARPPAGPWRRRRVLIPTKPTEIEIELSRCAVEIRAALDTVESLLDERAELVDLARAAGASNHAIATAARISPAVASRI